MLNSLFAYLTVALLDIKERQDGQTMVEYALLLVFIVLVALVGATALGIKVDDVYDNITTKLGGSGAATP